jgi:hypothetical protein
MPDTPLVYSLYEAFGARCNETLTSAQIVHHQFIARDDEHARQLARERSEGMTDIEIRRVMDVRSTP